MEIYFNVSTLDIALNNAQDIKMQLRIILVSKFCFFFLYSVKIFPLMATHTHSHTNHPVAVSNVKVM